jgi:tRNA(Ile)-lysidine synthase
MYHVWVQGLAKRLRAHIETNRLLKAGDRVGVAVSGGADSVALLCLLLELRSELGLVLFVVHVNHQLRGAESDADEHFVSALAKQQGLEFECATYDVALHAKHNRLSLETAARQLRYAYFAQLLRQKRFNHIATGHTLDDQAETVLMRLIRGTGLRGIGGIYPRVQILDEQGAASGSVVRPLLWVRHGELKTFLRTRQQEWREDATNQDVKHVRNRLRHSVLPLLEREFSPAITERFAQLSNIVRREEEFWTKICSDLEEKMVRPRRREATVGFSLDLKLFASQPLCVQRRLLHHLGRSSRMSLGFEHIERILAVAGEEVPDGKRLELPRAWRVVRRWPALQFHCERH